jgi:hypothetical protein
LALVAASARILPLLRKAATLGSVAKPTSICPPSRSVNMGAAPR